MQRTSLPAPQMGCRSEDTLVMSACQPHSSGSRAWGNGTNTVSCRNPVSVPTQGPEGRGSPGWEWCVMELTSLSLSCLFCSLTPAEASPGARTSPLPGGDVLFLREAGVESLAWWCLQLLKGSAGPRRLAPADSFSSLYLPSNDLGWMPLPSLEHRCASYKIMYQEVPAFCL